MDAIYWGTAALSLLAVWLNIRKHAACFAIWGVTNAAWTIVDYLHGIYAQAALQLVYFALSIYGFLKWTGRRTGKEVNHGLEDSP